MSAVLQGRPVSAARLVGLPDPFDLDFTPHGEAGEGTSFEIVALRGRAPQRDHHAVLVVDGNATTGARTAALLREAGYHTAVETTPRAAARHMTRLGAPGLLVLEMDLPQMSGLDFLKRLRASRRLKDTPVIFYTAHAEREDVVGALQSGADGLVSRSAGDAALRRAVGKVLPLPG